MRPTSPTNRAAAFFRSRQHPIKIITYTRKQLWLLVIPLAKYLIAAQFNFQSWFRSHWLEILTVALIFGYAVLRWVFVYYEVGDDHITAHTGFFGIKTTRVNFSEISAFSLNQGYLDRLIHSCTIYLDTGASSSRTSDISFNLNRKQAFEIYHSITAVCHNKPKYVYRSRRSDLMIFSLLFSSTLSGMLVVVGIIFQAYRIMGREVELRLLREVNSRIESSPILEVIPAYILAGATLIFGLWLISFVANLMRHWGFSCTKSSGLFIIRSGKGARRRHVLRRKRINYIDYKQSFLMKLFRITTVEVGCTGYGKRHREISAMIPITTNSRVNESMKELLPAFPPVRGTVSTDKSSMPFFMLLPFVCSFVPSAAAYVLYPHFPRWHREIIMIAVIATIPLIWLTIVKAAASLCTYIGFEDGFCTMSFCGWYKFHKVAAPVDKISKIVISRHIFQRLGGTCAVYVYTNDSRATKHYVKGVNYKAAVELLEKNAFPFEQT